MQYINNDIDDLYRRAAEDYPLHTGGSDWDKVFKALHEEPKEKKRRRFIFFWRFTAVSIGILALTAISYYWLPSFKTGKVSVSNHTASPVASNTTAGQTKHQIQEQHESVSGTIQEQVSNGSNKPPTTNGHSFVTALSSASPAGKKMQTGHPYNYTKTERSIAASRKVSGHSFTTSSSATASETAILPVKYNEALHYLSLLHRYVQIDLNKTALPLTIVTQLPAGEKKNKSFAAHMYVSLIAGIDQSNIKMQKTSAPGYTTGVLATYQFAPRWSVEAGAWWDQKSYYTKGEYFNMKLYSNATIESVDGTCGMIELPLQIKYRFGHNETKYWYGIWGVSSYLMKKEDYEYEYATGSSTPSEGYKTFRNSTNNWFSVFRISGGYTTPLGSLGALRIEPYVSIPMQGLGVGKLPITSAGINVGLVRKLF